MNCALNSFTSFIKNVFYFDWLKKFVNNEIPIWKIRVKLWSVQISEIYPYCTLVLVKSRPDMGEVQCSKSLSHWVLMIGLFGNHNTVFACHVFSEDNLLKLFISSTHHHLGTTTTIHASTTNVSMARLSPRIPMLSAHVHQDSIKLIALTNAALAKKVGLTTVLWFHLIIVKF